MKISVDASVKKLRTSYIDILYMHWWDYNTSIEEVMDGRHQPVLSGKVLYVDVSDTPAWVVSDANRLGTFDCIAGPVETLSLGVTVVLISTFQAESAQFMQRSISSFQC